MKRLALAFVLFATPASAQEYHPPSKDLWVQMAQAIQAVPMPLSAHQQIANILASVQQQAANDAKQKPSASPSDGGSSPQPEVRQEGRSAPGRR